MDPDDQQLEGTIRRFVGREAQLAHLERIVSAPDPVHAVLVEGDPGIGKSRLLAELDATMTAAGWLVVWGRCWSDEGAPPYWPWTQVVRALSGRTRGTDLASVVLDEPEGVDRVELFDATADLLHRTAEEQPVLVVLDDLHEADVESLALFRFVAHQLGRSPVVIVGSYRVREAWARSAIREHLEALGSAGAVVHLEGLDIEALEALVDDHDRIPEIHAVTGGNPLFVDQIVRLGDVAKSVTIGTDPLRAAIKQRVDGLDAVQREVLATAAVLTGDTDAQHLADLLEVDVATVSEALDALADSGLIGSADSVGHSLHPLVAEVAHASIDAAAVAQLHVRAAERVGDDPDRLAERAFPHLRSGPAYRDAAVDACTRAAEVAMAASAWDDALAHWERAEAVLAEESAEATDPRRLEILLAYGRALRIVDRLDEASDVFENARDLALELGDAEGFALATLRGGVQYFFAADLDVPIAEHCRTALDKLPDGDSALRVRLLAELATRSVPGVGAEPEMADEAVAMARRVEDPVALGSALCAQQRSALGPTTLARRVSASHEILALARATQDPTLAVQGRYLLLGALLETGDLRGFESEFGAGRRAVDHLSDRHEIRLGRWYAFLRAVFDGDVDEAEAISKRGLEASLEAGDPAAWRIHGAQLLALADLRGSLEELVPMIEGQLRASPSPVYLAALAAAHGHAGRLDEARAAIDRVDVPVVPDDMHWLLTMALLADAAVTVRDSELAIAVREQLLPYADRWVSVNVGASALGPVARSLGMLAALLDRSAEAVAHFERAVQVSARLGARPWLVRCQLDLAEAMVEAGRGDEPRVGELIAEVTGAVERLGLAYLAPRVERLRPAMREAVAPPVAVPETGRPTVSVLGTFEVVSVGGSSARWNSRKARELLKILVAQRGAPVHREVLMDLIWPDVDPAALGNRLSVALSTVRRSLDPDRVFATNDLIDADRTSVRLRTDAVEVDAEVFLSLAHDAFAAVDADAPDAHGKLVAALHAHHGPALPDEPYSEWATGLRSEVWATHLRVVRALADACVASGDDVAAVDALRRVVEADPHDEVSRRRLVDALERIGAAGSTIARHVPTA